MGILDILDAPKDSLFGMLNQGASADDILNQVPGYSMRAPDDPYAALDKKQKEEAAKKAALGVFDNGAQPVPQSGISGQQAMQPGPFGSLAPMAPQQSTAPLGPNQPSPLDTAQWPAGPVGAPAAQASIPIPQPRPAVPSQALPPPVANAQASAPIDQTTTPTAPAASAAQQVSPQPGLGDRLDSFVDTHRGQLMALAGGLAGAPSIGQGIGRGFTAAAAALPADQKFALQQGGNGALFQALRSAGAPKEQAFAATQNPELAKAMIQSYISDRKSEIKSIKSKDAFGNETERLVSVNPYDNTSKDISSPGAQTAAATSSASFAPGVTSESFDHTKVGDEYLNQFSPEVQAGVKAYLRGDSLPTGRQQLAQTIKTVAQKYGDDIGTPANDQAYFQRKSFATSLGDTKSGVGMQAKGFQQGLEHAVNLSDKLVAMKNFNGLGLEPVADWSNYVRNLTTAQQDKVRGVTADSQALAGEVGKLYSGASGGGVHERQTTQQLLGNPNMSGPAAAGGLESTIELMEGGLRTLEQRRDELFPGSEKPRGSNFKGDAQEAAIQHIKKNIAVLRGEQSAQPDQAAAAKIAPGKYVWSPDKGLQPQ